ncbi:MAG: YciI family protein, partial [Candidatus Acidiferrum sp.]
PYADSKEQLGGFHIIEVADLDAAIAWAACSPTALHGVVEVRPVVEGTWLTRNILDFVKPE